MVRRINSLSRVFSANDFQLPRHGHLATHGQNDSLRSDASSQFLLHILDPDPHRGVHILRSCALSRLGELHKRRQYVPEREADPRDPCPRFIVIFRHVSATSGSL